MIIISDPNTGAVIIRFADTIERARMVAHLANMDRDDLLYALYPETTPPEAVDIVLDRIKQSGVGKGEAGGDTNDQ